MDTNVALFSGLTTDDVQFLARRGVVRTYPKNAVLINEGDKSNSFYIIKTGKVRVYASDEDGKEITLSIQGPNEYFGELTLIDDSPRSASVVTMEKTKVSVVSKADFERCLSEKPKMAAELVRPMAERIRLLTESVKNLALRDVYGRVRKTLYLMATEQDGHLVIEDRITHQELASMIGASREMVSRIMKDLINGEYIAVEDKKITVRRKLPRAW